MKVLMVIAPTRFRDEEYSKPKEIFEKSGIEVVTASTTTVECSGMLGARVKPNILIKDAKEQDFSVIIIVGGSGSSMLFNERSLLELIRKFNDSKKIIGAICLACIVLIKAGIMKGKKMTGWSPDTKVEAQKAGVTYIGEEIIEDNNIITGIGPSAAVKFGQTIVKKLRG